ncbi:hypothetical protein Q8F57_000450 [Paraburkholderia terrae]|uniref:hypothetical protein n=1 Tax=Paraburkholderia terrae TaxID=311230 RepID=UPI00296ABFC7|nr:hypothetical protein [Paraburkholderia terrae]MDW3660587.1 hypothetical protein [Paraburkholderia terrae]
MDINFFLCTPNAIGDTQILVKDKNNGMAIIFNDNVPQDTCSPASARANASGHADLEISLNGGTPYGVSFVEAGQKVNVF